MNGKKQKNMEEETEVNGYKRNGDGTFADGTAPGPGRIKDTPEKKLEKKALRVVIDEYRESLSDILPQLSPVLKEMAMARDIQAIKEVHDQVMGKAKQTIAGDKENPIAVIMFDESFKKRHESTGESKN